MLITKEYLVREYVEKQKSTYEIAKDLGTYANVIRRALVKYGIPLRNKSESQTVALKNGRRKHPTRGKHRSPEVRGKIGESVRLAWERVGEEERKLRIERAKLRWANMPEDQREKVLKAASEAFRKTAKDGSRLEKYLLIQLRLRGYYIIFHHRNLLSREGLHVDISIPDLRIAIEVDGPAHSLPIYGESKLASNIISDNTKTGLLINGGYSLIRIQNLSKNHSESRYAQILTLLLNAIQSVKRNNPREIIIKDGK